jgi:hypothetical protein
MLAGKSASRDRLEPDHQEARSGLVDRSDFVVDQRMSWK